MKLLKFVVPIAIYFVIEWLLGPIWAMAIAVVLSAVQLIGEYATGRRINRSYIYDIVIILIFGLIEYFTEGVSMQLMRIATPLILAALLLLSLHSKFDIVGNLGGGMFDKMMKNPYNRYNLRRSQRRMMAWCLICAAAYTFAWLMPQNAAAQWIDGYMLLTLLAAYVAMEIIAGRIAAHKYRNAEWVPLVQDDGKVVGSAPRPLVHNGSLWLHPVVHLHVTNKGQLLLQLRPKTKKIQPGRWDTAVGGHIAAGENLEAALKREVYEEIGLQQFKAQLVKRYVWECPVEHEYVFSFVTESKGPFETKNVGEVDELRFWSREELKRNIGKGVFTPNLEKELDEWLLEYLGGRR